ncbi:hypothetical protein LOK49_LG12G00707 [Camellia lanceoleosa]|uniref:Uncharacterized protein n=1 Tax=Camellia lanceoleosa TaxID=1840588 RepID=A0ACC0FVX6_9ERIC|nr:hypothetical protein LOK49_LG12G00707 [Camellia lanceoleosa]
MALASAVGGGNKIFKSTITNHYVRRVVDKSQRIHVYLSADATDATNQNVEFILEPASDGSGMCHIKCRDTNKYWQVKSAQPADQSWITADADATNEDRQSLACTLFAIEYFGTSPTTTIRLRHCYLKRYACVHNGHRTPPNSLCALSESTDKDSKDVFVYSECK